VRDTPRELAFLSILQHLLQIDASDVIGDVLWNVVDKLVAAAALLTHKTEAERLLADGTRRLEKATEGQQQLVNRAACGTDCSCRCHEFDSESQPMSPTAARKQREAAAADSPASSSRRICCNYFVCAKFGFLICLSAT
jgi:hypothetical protein